MNSLEFSKNNNIGLISQCKIKISRMFRHFVYAIKTDKLLLIAFALMILILFIRTTFLNYNYIPSSSMNPNLAEGDIIMVNKMSYNLNTPFLGIKLFNHTLPERGDIVTFDAIGISMVKRVMALPGDTVELKDNNFIINGVLLNVEPSPNKYVDNKVFIKQRKHPYKTFEETNYSGEKYDVVFASNFNKNYIKALVMTANKYVIPKDHYFLIGDNRNLSKDSRYFGPVHISNIDSKVIGVAFNYKYFSDMIFDKEGKVPIRGMLLF